MQELQAEVEKMMEDPEKRKAIEAWQTQIQGGVEKLRQDPEMREYFEDLEKNGLAAVKKYEGNEKILRKLAEATGVPPEGMGGMPGTAGATTAEPLGTPPVHGPGAEVIVRGLRARPDLNGRRALVLPPTAEELESVRGTGRVILRLLDTGDQFAVKAENLIRAADDTALGPDEALLQAAAEAAEPAATAVEPPPASTAPAVTAAESAEPPPAASAKLPSSLAALAADPELQPVVDDIRKNGMVALDKYWSDPELMEKISKALGTP